MAQFRASIQGQRGEVTRLGSKSSGLAVQANGWNLGVTVTAEHEDGRDVFRIWRTSGSSPSRSSKLIATITEEI